MGGKADMAQGSGTEVAQVSAALEAAELFAKMKLDG